MKTPALPLLLAALLVGCGPSPSAPVDTVRPVKLFTVPAAEAEGVRQFPGQLVASDEVELSFRLAGHLKTLDVKQGQRVERGQLIATLDDTDLRLRLRDRQATFDLARAQYQRLATLSERQLVARAQLDQQKAQLDSAEAALKLARQELGYARLEAPFGGVIAQLPAQNHQMLQPKQPVAILQSADTYDVQFQLPESLLERVDGASLRSDYQPLVRLARVPGRELPARYKEHSTRPDPATLSYTVTLTIERPQDATLLPGMSATIEVDFSQLGRAAAPVLRVPVEAVFSADDGAPGHSQVWVVSGDDANLRVARREVRLGQPGRDGIQVLDGLQPGERIVAAGTAELRDGQHVRAWQRERGL
ncbi:efflux RND transporter periplasmic adaptor subunit [Pseudomonas citronellolis]|uniref:efflux RND transporter periplasmic adaptor subunit n=1 Tax=Pseudomonas citronellolis TaxID=53408 RepID=UPI0023E3D04A|nr:efflux RND transporter periplasmic adaptor subunit [Pseudomonas citronellolis]MDF3931145.1 efflux RND transporter periplasmic adaptor subunit [Pseudomonas citronellolis]